ncbi:hypothetical protein HT749_01335 [Burkholderia cepacia]|uniref:hypothetical protein n=1 Tax=Burkholderia cepacia TaxID=292 RepID=UPI00157BA730|nr:hypothetical protein [Burkholderia cepacia]NTX42040.1 hypothetical protein [Burkholderia cepacia]
MKAITATAVATATVASNISYAQPAPASDMPAALPGSLRYTQPEDAPQMAPALTSYLNAAQQASLPKNQSVSPQGGKEVAQMISKPKTPIEFVQNLKVIFDENLLLQGAFYTEANLKDIFSLENVNVDSSIEDSEQNISISGSVSDAIFPRIKTSDFFGRSTSGAQFVGGKIDQSGVVRAGLNFGMYEGGPDFDASTKIFEKKFVRVPPQPSPHGGPGAATAPHGNETWKFEQIDDQTERAITIGFNSAGSLSSVLIQIKKIKK